MFLGKKGFTLIEINLVLLLFAGAIMGLLGLLPVGLQQSSLASSDTARQLFADHVLGQIQGNSVWLTNWADWQDEDQFTDAVLEGVRIDGAGAEVGEVVFVGSGKYLGVDRVNLSYYLEIKKVTSPVNFGNKFYRATIWVSDNKADKDKSAGDFKDSVTPCVADMAYMGVAP